MNTANHIDTLRAALARHEEASRVLARSTDARELDRSNPIGRAAMDEAVDRREAVVVAARALHRDLETEVVRIVETVRARSGFTSPAMERIAPLVVLPPFAAMHAPETARSLIAVANRVAEARRIVESPAA